MKRVREKNGKGEENPREELESQYMRRLEEAKSFCQDDLYDFPMTEAEYETLCCPTEKYEERRLRERLKAMVTEEFEAYINGQDAMEEDDSEEEEENAAEREKEREKTSYRVKVGGTDSEIGYVIDNYVHVTYFHNALSGKRCNFNLLSLALKLLNYFVEYSCKKFAKVNFRHLRGPSHLLYKSSVVVETGSDNQALSRRLLKKTIRILRKICHYPNLNIRERSCQNIVAAGRYNDKICINVLKDKFQDSHQEKKKFSGVVIKERALKEHLSYINQPSAQDIPLEEGDKLLSDGYILTSAHRDDDDDSELLRQVNLPEPDVWPVPEGGEGEEEFVDDQRIRVGRDEDEVESPELVFNDDDLAYYLNRKRKNCTFLVFQKGQIICTGSKSEKELLKAFTLLCELLDQCKESNPENRKFESDLVRAQNKKRKREEEEVVKEGV